MADSSSPTHRLFTPAAAEPRSRRNSPALSSLSPIISVYISSHGYGHATRTSALLERLVARIDVRFRVRASCPRWLWPAALEERTIDWNATPSDVGVVQSSDLEVDHARTKAALALWRANYQSQLERESARLHDSKHKTALVFADVAPLAFDVAHNLGLPAVAMANFSWDWIYEELGYQADADAAAFAYGHADLLLELEPGCPMPAFPARSHLGVIGRRSLLDRRLVRNRLGVALEERLILPGFRALDPDIISLPAPNGSIRYVIPGNPVEREDVVKADDDLSFVDLLAASDLVVAKPGYGIIGDSSVAGTPILYVTRAGFPEDLYLERWLTTQAVSAPVDATVLARGSWLSDAQELLGRERPRPRGLDGLEKGCDEIIARLG